MTAADESAVTARVREAVTLWASPGSAGSAGGRSLVQVTAADRLALQRIGAHAIGEGQEVTVVKGRKVPIGTKGIVFYVGEGQWGWRVGFKDSAGNEQWTDATNVKLSSELSAAASLTTVAGLTYEENDGSIKHCLLLANDGHAFGDYYFYDAVALDFGDAADVMRNALKPGAKTVEVEFPQGERRRYVNLAAARKAVENYVAQRYASRIPPTPW